MDKFTQKITSKELINQGSPVHRFTPSSSDFETLLGVLEWFIT